MTSSYAWTAFRKLLSSVFRYSIHTLKSQFDIKEKYRNSFKLRYLQNFEVFLTPIPEYF